MLCIGIIRCHIFSSVIKYSSEDAIYRYSIVSHLHDGWWKYSAPQSELSQRYKKKKKKKVGAMNVWESITSLHGNSLSHYG